MRAVQIVDLTGPESALAEADAPRAGAVAHAHARQRRADRRARRRACPSRRCSRRAASTRSSRRSRSCPGARWRARCGARPRARASRGRPRGGVLHARGVRGGRGGAGLPHLPAVRRARLRAGRRPDPQLPHRLLLAEACAAGWRRARPCSCTARRAGSARRRSRSRRGSARGRSRWCRATRRSGWRASAGADEVVRSDGAWKDEAKELSGGGVDVVIDPVGGDRFTDSLRSLREGGRVVVVGFTGGSIPEVRVNRLLLNNTEVVGAGWGAFVHGEAGREPRDRRRARAADRRRARAADGRARASRSSGRARRSS